MTTILGSGRGVTCWDIDGLFAGNTTGCIGHRRDGGRDGGRVWFSAGRDGDGKPMIHYTTGYLLTTEMGAAAVRIKQLARETTI